MTPPSATAIPARPARPIPGSAVPVEAPACAATPAIVTPLPGDGELHAPVPHAHRTGALVGRFWLVQGSHALIDVYPIFFSALILVLQKDLSLTPAQVAAIFATGPVVSGLPQLFFAWATDRLDTRFCAWFGLALGALSICSIGLATSFWQLWAMQVIGLIGTGMFHPVSAALSGQLGGRMWKGGRAWGISIFYTAGMIGGFAGALVCTRINAAVGTKGLLWLILPGFVVAAALLLFIRRLPHRHDNHKELRASMPADDLGQRWYTVGLLFFQNVLRFTVNTGLCVVFPMWAAVRIPGDVERATNLNGNLLAAMTIGMGVFGIMAQRFSPHGREKWPMFWLTLLGSIFVGLTGYTGSHTGPWGMYAMAALASIGFSAIIPTTMSIAQRLLPGHTGLASALMLGVAWAGSGIFATALVEVLLGTARIGQVEGLDPARVDLIFVGFAALLILAAALTAAMPARLLARIASHH